jgi:hypothetical protein
MSFELHQEADLSNVEAHAKTVVNGVSASLRTLGIDDILKRDIPEASMLIEGILPAAGASLLVGSAKSGKTLNAVQMAIAVASGSALYGMHRILAPGPVLVIEKDDPAGVASIKTILNRSNISGIPFHLIEHAELVGVEFGSAFVDQIEERILTLALKLIVLDSYTALRGSRSKNVDIVKAEQCDLSLLDALAKRTNCAIVVIHHSSKGYAGLDWSEKAAGTFAMSAATEAQIFISRFLDLETAAPERLVRIRGRHSEDLEMVLRFRKDTLDYEHVLTGGAAAVYPFLLQLKNTFGSQSFGPKELCFATGMSKATATRQIDRLCRADAIQKRGYGEYFIKAVSL